ncbi:MAG: hypothetical protein O7H41_18880 [Planctomycetota bacterium]|nr:hypothetical protein [Planctomycetota bacterium]
MTKNLPRWVTALVVALVVGLFGAIVAPLIVENRRSAEQDAIIGALRRISKAQVDFHGNDLDSDEFHDYASSLAELRRVGLIGDTLSSGPKSGYVFSLSGGTHEWQCSATPIQGSDSILNFIVCADGVVRFAATGQIANCESHVIQ